MVADSHGLEQDEVGHVAGADLEHIHVLIEDGHESWVGDLTDHRQAGLLANFGEELEALDAEALEGVGR